MSCKEHENETSPRKKIRSEKEKRDLMNRLKRIEGQVRGLQRMLDEDAYCPDILVQASAVNSALNSFCRTLLLDPQRYSRPKSLNLFRTSSMIWCVCVSFMMNS